MSVDEGDNVRDVMLHMCGSVAISGGVNAIFIILLSILVFSQIPYLCSDDGETNATGI